LGATYTAPEPITGTTGLYNGASVEYFIPAGDWEPISDEDHEVAQALLALGLLTEKSERGESAKESA
jgi:hypothetical protein